MGTPNSSRVALVTGVSRRAGIGFAIAQRLAAAGVRVFAHHHVPHDAERAWGADPAGIDAVIAAIGGETAHAGFDLASKDAPSALFDAARAAFGHVDILVCNHASGGPDGSLAEVTAEMLDEHWTVNTRASLESSSIACWAFRSASSASWVGSVVQENARRMK